MMRWLKDPLLWLIILFVALLLGLPYSGPLSPGGSPNRRGRSTSRKVFSSWRWRIFFWW